MFPHKDAPIDTVPTNITTYTYSAIQVHPGTTLVAVNAEDFIRWDKIATNLSALVEELMGGAMAITLPEDDDPAMKVQIHKPEDRIVSPLSDITGPGRGYLMRPSFEWGNAGDVMVSMDMEQLARWGSDESVEEILARDRRELCNL